MATYAVVEEGNHAVGVHALASVELVVLEVADNLLRESLSGLLELINLIRAGLLELGLDGLHVRLYRTCKNRNKAEMQKRVP